MQDEKDMYMETTKASKYSAWHPCRHITRICKRVAQLAHVVELQALDLAGDGLVGFEVDVLTQPGQRLLQVQDAARRGRC